MKSFTVSPKFTSLAIAIAGLLASGCGNMASNKLAGTWELQIGELEEAGSTSSGHSHLPGDDSTVEDDTNTIVDGVGGGGEASGGMKLVFQSNGSLKTITDFSAAQSEKDWRWSLLSWDKESSVAVIRCEMSHETVETSIQFIDDDTIELVPPNIDVLQTRLRFVRK